MANNVDNFTENCPRCGCLTADVIEYDGDGDEDMYLMKCENGHTYWTSYEDEVWK